MNGKAGRGRTVTARLLCATCLIVASACARDVEPSDRPSAPVIVARSPSAPAAPPPSRPTPSATPRPTELGKPDQALADLADANHAIAIALVRSPGRSWRGVYGPVGGLPVGPGARFSIASTTKTFTATIVLQLVGSGRLTLDETVEDVLPARVRSGERITIRQLLNHTSGIGGGLGPLDEQSPLISEPGTEHHYANANFDILGLIAERLTGTPLNELVLDRIFRPLDLSHTSFGSASLGAADRDALPWLGPPGDSDGHAGSGGIASTSDDLATFFSGLLRGDLLGGEELVEMLETVDTRRDPLAGNAGVPLRAGLGIFRFDLPCGIAYGHGGDMPGGSNQALASPDGTKIVVVAQDAAGWSSASATAQHLFCLAGG